MFHKYTKEELKVIEANQQEIESLKTDIRLKKARIASYKAYIKFYKRACKNGALLME